ncbi:MAG: hypothetical protein QM689_04800 [Oscillospiraceae bacterium]
MPSFAVHLFAAKKIAEDAGLSVPAEFFLGAVAPDAVNMQDYAPEAVRYRAHFRVRDEAAWQRSLYDFLKTESPRHSAPQTRGFVLGYFVHIATDLAWDQLVQPKLFAFLKAAGVAPAALKKAKWEEIFRLNDALMRREAWKTLRDALMAARIPALDFIDEALVEAHRTKLVRAKSGDKSGEATAFLTEEAVARTAERVTMYLKEACRSVSPQEATWGNM